MEEATTTAPFVIQEEVLLSTLLGADIAVATSEAANEADVANVERQVAKLNKLLPTEPPERMPESPSALPINDATELWWQISSNQVAYCHCF